MPDHASKRCGKCGEVKPLDAFHRLTSAPDGRQYVCRECRRQNHRVNREAILAQRRQHYQDNRDELTERSRLWAQANPDKRRESDRQYREANPEKQSERHRRYYETNGEAVREHVRQYREANPDVVRERLRRDYAALKARVLAHYGAVCACCGTAEKLTIDHVRGNGAEHRKQLFGGQRKGSAQKFYRWVIASGFPEGLQTLCLPCNQSKGRGERCRLMH